MDNTYYIKTFDPSSEASNYFRIKIHADTSLSRSKYSAGFFDRDAVERLFGEASVNRQFRETHPNFFDDKTDQAAKDAEAAAKAAKAAPSTGKQEALEKLLLHIVDLHGRYWFQLQFDPELQAQLSPALERAAKSIGAAKAALDKDPAVVVTAARELAFARAVLEGVRAAVDGDVIVRFYDGAGNEIDVTTKTMVIFVASDASRFTSALEQLAGEEAARQNILLTILGSKIKEAERLDAQVTHSDSQRDEVAEELGEALDAVKAQPKKLDDTTAAADAAKARQEELETMRKEILKAATAAAGRSKTFSSADEIRGFADGLDGTS